MIDTLNKFAVMMRHSNRISIGNPNILPDMTPDDALNLAAWLVAMAEPFATSSFRDVLDAVKR